MAFGKINTISTDLSKVIFGLLGESGVGKSTTLYHMAKTLFGDDGYLLMDMGSEWGSEYIEGVNAEQIETYKKFLEVTNDIIKNKDTEYSHLKLVICDTLDALFEVGEPYLVKLYTQEHMGEKNFVAPKTINAVEGGFMHGQDRLIDMVVDQIVKLRRAGVGFWYSGHVKRRSTDDVFSGDTYDQLTTNMSQRYFSAIKNKTHALGIAYIDRTLTQQEIGDENPVTHKKKTINKIASESRKVKFRDDSYTADSKSRLKYIVDEVNLDENEIIKALQDAIAEEKKNPYEVAESAKKISTKKVTELTPSDSADIAPDTNVADVEDVSCDVENDDPPFDIPDELDEEDFDPQPLRDAIQAKFKLVPKESPLKSQVRDTLKEFGGLAKIADASILERVLKMMD